MIEMLTPELPLVLTVAEAQQLLQISKNHLYDAIADGTIPSIRIGRAIRIPRAALEKLLSNAPL